MTAASDALIEQLRSIFKSRTSKIIETNSQVSLASPVPALVPPLCCAIRYNLNWNLAEGKKQAKAELMARLRFDPKDFAKAVPKATECEHTKTKVPYII